MVDESTFHCRMLHLWQAINACVDITHTWIIIFIVMNSGNIKRFHLLYVGAQDGGRPPVRAHRHPHAAAQLPHGRPQGVQRRPAQEPRQVGDSRVVHLGRLLHWQPFAEMK